MTRERAAALPPDDFRSRSPEFREPRLSKNLELVERLRQVGARHGRTPGEVAIAWTLRPSCCHRCPLLARATRSKRRRHARW